ncbi:MAG: LPS export ABC transporter permease LptF [Porticoccaceae bacterium]|nr:LPS export ABC transporter permease LptF [Porticoccaceae bacterium]
MIIFRYLLRQLLGSTVAVCFVLLLVFMSSRFVKYLSDAAQGKYDAEVLFALMGYRLPEFLELLLPLSFFLSILLVYGRFYLDSEMTVLSCCGVSRNQVLRYTMVSSLIVAAVVGFMSIELTPSGSSKATALERAQQQRAELNSMPAKRFQKLQAGSGVAYAEEVTDGQLDEVFYTESVSNAASDHGQVLVLASRGYQKRSENLKDNFLVLEDGYRIEGTPGEALFRITYFNEFGRRLAQTREDDWRIKKLQKESLSTTQLMASSDPEHSALLHRRISWPVMVLILTIAAIPLSKTNPRQGRYMKLLPAIFLFVLYWQGLESVVDKASDGELNVYAGIWGVHLLFLVIAVVIFYWDRLRCKFSGRRSGECS